ncbi:MAG: galactose-1-phosphate uridylyltransferase [Tissierellia bacterium]|nr:galactose-1-phosphate uridylyltransferase [Tissierellia bacterium]
MAELRWNPLLRDWTMVAAHRQNRPDMPKDFCPFCPGSGKVPQDYDVFKYDNDFPVLSPNPPEPDDVGSAFYKTRKAHGKCEVILYSPEHNASLCELPVEHLKKLVDLWTERFVELSRDEEIKYIFIFENRGKEVGVTMPHPHGQIYGYPYIPLKLKVELNSARSYFEENQQCLFCKIVEEEEEMEVRVILDNEDFIVYLPFFTDYPYGVYISAKRHMSNFTQFTEGEKINFAKILKETTGTFDTLFHKKFPYMMGIYQNPVNSPEYGNVQDYYHFHVKFYPPLRAENSIKYNASSETGAWAAANPRSLEETAVELREAYKRFKEKDL